MVAKAKSAKPKSVPSPRPNKAYATMVATLGDVIDWSTKTSMRALLGKVESPSFVEPLSNSGIVRFASWQRIDSAPPATWEDRPNLTDEEVDSADGVPIEVMVDVANRAGLDPWFCMPHWADDGYVKQFAELVKDRLDPARVVYLEHSNDVANSALPQHHSLRATARSSVTRFGEDSVGAAIKCHAARSLEIFRIWREVFEGRDRVVAVLGASATEEQALSELFSLEPVLQSVDAVVLGPVEGALGEIGDAAEAILGGTLREVPSSAIEGMRGAAELAARFSKRLFVCELLQPTRQE